MRDLRPGEILLARGEAPSEDVFVVMCGRVSVHLAGAESPSHTVIDAGECVGEMSAIDGEPISATVTALESARLLAIPEPIVWSLVNTSHAVARNLLYILSRRMRHDNAVIVFGMDRQRELEHAAGTDGLTGLHNRRWMNEAFSRQLDRCARDAVPSSLVLIDVDALKAYNDRAGHLAGDLLICAVADVLARHIRPGDLLARFGGTSSACCCRKRHYRTRSTWPSACARQWLRRWPSRSRYKPPFPAEYRAALPAFSSKSSCAAPTRLSIGRKLKAETAWHLSRVHDVPQGKWHFGTRPRRAAGCDTGDRSGVASRSLHHRACRRRARPRRPAADRRKGRGDSRDAKPAVMLAPRRTEGHRWDSWRSHSSYNFAAGWFATGMHRPPRHGAVAEAVRSFAVSHSRG